METATKPSKISRVDIRYRHQAEDVFYGDEFVRDREAESGEEEEELPVENVDEPLLSREQKGRLVMGRAHRVFHRQQAELKTRTVIVEVVSSVDVLVARATENAPADPVAPTGVLPSVPAVPPFPTDLIVPSVPGYPFQSGVPSLQTQDPTSQPGVTPSAPAPTQTTLIDPVSRLPSQNPSSFGFNSTISSTKSSSRLSSLSITSSSSLRSSASTTSSMPSSSGASSSASFSDQASSLSISATASSSLADSTTTAGAPFGGDPANTALPPGVAPTSGPGSGSGGGAAAEEEPLGTPAVVGSVVGSLAGAALLLFILLFLIKRHKRKGTRAITGPETTGNAPYNAADNQPIAVSGQQMATRSSFVPAGAAAFFNRFSGASRSTVSTNTTGERSFQRVSGRKLPSAFSEGMTSDQFTRNEVALSGSSFYRDDQGFYGGTGVVASKEFGKETGDPTSHGAMGAKERIMPSPARTPIIHHPDDAPPFGTSRNGGSAISPPHSPNPDYHPRPTLGRSHPSQDGSRSSRFTENV